MKFTSVRNGVSETAAVTSTAGRNGSSLGGFGWTSNLSIIQEKNFRNLLQPTSRCVGRCHLSASGGSETQGNFTEPVDWQAASRKTHRPHTQPRRESEFGRFTECLTAHCIETADRLGLTRVDCQIAAAYSTNDSQVEWDRCEKEPARKRARYAPYSSRCATIHYWLEGRCDQDFSRTAK